MPQAARQIRRPVPQRATNSSIHLSAPVGGINASDPASSMQPSDCLYLYNLIPFQYGLRVRSGWREWVTNVGNPVDSLGTGLYDDGSPTAFSLSAPLGGSTVGSWTGTVAKGVKTLMGFTARVSTGNRLLACTADGIYDVTRSTDTPTRVYTWPQGTYTDINGNTVEPAMAGIVSSTSFANASGEHFLACCDGLNGYVTYAENTATWTKIRQAATVAWVASTSYAAGDYRLNGGLSYECTVAGTSASTGGPTGTDTAIVDGDATWTYVPSISGADPGSFRFVMSWKNRIWFIPEDSSVAYYLPVGQFTGTVNPIYFGSRFRYGGHLVGLYSWTVDGGTGIDDKLVAISSGGDVVVYAGTDPTFAETFALVGVWWAGQVPPGRNIASDFGGDLFILSRLGCIPLSRLVSGGLIRDPNTFATAKVANLFNVLMTDRGHLDGWSIKMHPADNLLLISVPATPDKPQEQLSMSLASKGWSRLRGIPMTCMEPWQGSLYFGTADSRVCRNDGYADGAALDGTGAYAIDCSILTAYSNFGNARKKRVHMVRPYFATDGTKPGYQAAARYDFDLSEVGVVPSTPQVPANAWGTGLWGVALWGSGSGTEGKIKGSTGMGSSVAVVLRMTTKTNTTLVGFDVIMDAGGLL